MKRRIRSPHPGVVVLPANDHHNERIRYKEPSTGKFKIERIPEDLDAPARMRWLKKKSLWLQARKLDSKPPPAAGIRVVDAIELYFEEIRVQASTLDSYARSARAMVLWAGLPMSTADLSLATLRGLRRFLNKEGLAPSTINFHLRQLSPMLRHWRKAGLVPNLTDQDIKDGFELFKAPFEKKVPLSFDEIRQLVLALGPSFGDDSKDVGPSDPHFRAYVLLLLLGGLRPGEALRLPWSAVHTTYIELPGAITKTRRPRTVLYDVSPSLAGILLPLAPSGWPGGILPSERLVFPWGRSAAQQRADALALPFPWTFQKLRVTCASFLTSAPGIYGGASAYMSSARLGHSVHVAETHYLRPVGIDRDARTLEEAMRIADLLP